LNRWWIYVLILMIGACVPTVEKKQTAIDEYYDINGLIDRQVRLLDSISPSLSKWAFIDDTEEKGKITPPDSTWEEELSIFKSMDINKPLLLDSYERVVDDLGEEKVISLISKSPKSTNVDTLVISMKKSNQPARIYAYLSNQNTLFKTSKNMEIIFKEYQKRHVLESYTIHGWQKMLTKDTTKFDIKARILY